MGINVSKISNANLISECHSRLNKIGEITFDNVKGADIKTRNFLSKNSPARLKELAKMNCFAANKVKTELDKKYGEKELCCYRNRTLCIFYCRAFKSDGS